MARVALDRVPTLARPPAVERAITEALALREKAREVTEAVAAAQTLVEELEREDVEAAAAKARAGEPLGTPAAALRKAKEALVLQERAQAATRLALALAEQEVVEAILASTDPWTAELDAEAETAREDGREAIIALRDACQRIGDGLAIRRWVESGVEGGGVFDHLATGVWTASVAPSSQRRTANGAPLTAEELFGYLAELVEPAPTPARPILGGPQAESAGLTPIPR
jgi:hypothetical protein